MITVCAISNGCACRCGSAGFVGSAYGGRVGAIRSVLGGLLDARRFEGAIKRVAWRLGRLGAESRECTGAEAKGCAARRCKTTTTSTAWSCDGIERILVPVRGAVTAKSLVGNRVPTERVRVGVGGAWCGKGELGVAGKRKTLSVVGPRGGAQRGRWALTWCGGSIGCYPSPLLKNDKGALPNECEMKRSLGLLALS